ncbi:MAG: hypothetical protein GEU26_19295 [Nitrososphaeraceae archaeon]|nr:hypothetical protein [Nitrososphaeraceae archaeon]
MINKQDLSLENGIIIQCKRCHHSWTYKGKNDYLVSCPHCGTKIGIRKLLLGLDQSVSGLLKTGLSEPSLSQNQCHNSKVVTSRNVWENDDSAHG